jgi:hypothetical protein
MARFDSNTYAIPRKGLSLDPARKAWKQSSAAAWICNSLLARRLCCRIWREVTKFSRARGMRLPGSEDPESSAICLYGIAPRFSCIAQKCHYNLLIN